MAGSRITSLLGLVMTNFFVPLHQPCFCCTFADRVFVTLRPPLHLTTSKVMVIVWRLRGNIIRTVLYIANVLPLQWTQLTKTVYTARWGLESFYVSRLHALSLCWCMFCFTLGFVCDDGVAEGGICKCGAI